MKANEPPVYQDPEFVQGQIAATRSLILGLANILSTREEFRAESLQRLEILKTALLASPASDARLQAVDDCADWVKKMTE